MQRKDVEIALETNVVSCSFGVVVAHLSHTQKVPGSNPGLDIFL